MVTNSEKKSCHFDQRGKSPFVEVTQSVNSLCSLCLCGQNYIDLSHSIC